MHSTSTTVPPELVEGRSFILGLPMHLTHHPDMTVATVQSIDCAVWQDHGRWHFRFLVEGTEDLILPESASPARADNLWEATCFEAFVGLGDEAYLEFNFSPSGEWSAYRFDRYREKMCDEPAEVEVWLEGGEGWIAVEAAVRAASLEPGSLLGLSAVIHERQSKSHWALSHPPGQPDFHNRSCFTALLANIAH
jgi:hypothetical protein